MPVVKFRKKSKDVGAKVRARGGPLVEPVGEGSEGADQAAAKDGVRGMWFAIAASGRAIPVGADHPARLTLAKAATISGQDADDLAEAWRESVGRWVGGVGVGAGEGTCKLGLQVGAGAIGGMGGSEAEIEAAAFRAYWYPELEPAHWAAFRGLSEARGLSWRGREVFPRVDTDMDGAERVVLITSIEVLRRRAHETGQYGGIRLVPAFGEDGLLESMTAAVRRGAGEFEGVALWDEFYGQYGRPGIWQEESPAPLPLRMPQVCLGKCAEAMALRMAFPAECAGVYVGEERPAARTAERGIGAGTEARRHTGTEGNTVSSRAEEVPVTLASLQRLLLGRDEWDSARWRAALARAKADVGDRATELQLCRRIWDELA